MRVLVGLNELEIGGSQLNALDLAVAVRDLGHDVSVFADYSDRPGPVADMVRDAGLPLELLRRSPGGQLPALIRPSVARALSGIIERRRIQLFHGYEIPMILDSFYGPHLRHGTPLVWTIYSMTTPWWMPRYPPLIVGAPHIAEVAAAGRPEPPTVVEIGIDTDSNSSSAVDASSFRREHGLGDDIVVGIVSRLEPSMKAEGIRLSIEAIRYVCDDRIRLVITGDGPSRATLEAMAGEVNRILRRPAVVFTGPLVDPRPAYAATDIALDMGGSAMRAMAFEKPLIVLGEDGFAKPCNPCTVEEFLQNGFYGIGSGDGDPLLLAQWIKDLADRPNLRSELGAFGRRLVADHFSLRTAAASLERVYLQCVDRRYPARVRAQEAVRTAIAKVASERLPDTAKGPLRNAEWLGGLIGYRHPPSSPS